MRCNKLKVLVTGSYNAGKSTFIDRVTQGTSLSIDRAGTTVAMDHGVTTIFGVLVHLFGTPGLRRFNILRKVLAHGADGVLLMLDSTDPSSFEEVTEIYDEICEYIPKAPIVCCVNKQDVKDSLSLDEMAKELKFTQDLITIGTSAVTGSGVDEAVKSIILAILRRYQGTLRTIDNFGKQSLAELATALGEKKEDTRRLLQWFTWRKILIADWDRMQFSLSPRIREIVDIFDIVEKQKILE